MQVLAVTVSVVLTLVAVALAAHAVARMLAVFRLGQPAVGRTDQPGVRTVAMLRETFGHTRMLKWSLVGAAHWFVLVGFLLLFSTLLLAYGQLLDPGVALPVLGHWAPWALLVEVVTALTVVAALVLLAVRVRSSPARAGRKSRFAGSTMWQGYYVELTILGVALAVLALRGLEGALAGVDSWGPAHVVSYPLVLAFSGLSPEQLRDGIALVAMLKIAISMAWLIVISLQTTMGVAWHRFLAFPNIWLKREAGGATGAEGTSPGVALGPLPPMRSRGEPVDFEDPGEDDLFGVGQVEHFTWKDLLDVSTCTECGRCQSQCPAWNTAKPLSPKLLVMGLRDHAHAKAPYLLAGGGKDAEGTERMPPERYAALPAGLREEAERPLVGTAEEGGVIDPDVLWSCTTCGACVDQCPVDIEHVDHVVDMRRHQVLVESAFPPELNGLFRNLERSGNPWGIAPASRMDWAKGLDFEVPVLGESASSLQDYDYLFFVGCAGAFEDRAKRTTRAVAELLHTAGVRFAVLGPGEGCTGDPARRSGNEFLFQMLAQSNVGTLNEAFGAGEDGEASGRAQRRIVVTCPHCFTTVGREYPQLGGHYAVVHHTQLLNTLVREGRLVPVNPVEQSVTYHDPCYLGRHNQVYSPPRELLGAVPGLEVTEMPRNGSRSFCCGAGGGRMWMEERIGKRINLERVDEALSVEPDAVVAACPFCQVMLGDGVTSRESERAAERRAEGGSNTYPEVEVLDVAQMLLRAVRRAPDPAAAAPGGPGAVAEESAGSEAGRDR